MVKCTPNAAMTTALLLHLHLLLLIPTLFFTATAAPPPQPVESPLPPQLPAPTNCSDELVSFSICLPYISSPPNNVTDWPSHQCCDDVASAFMSNTAVCLCHFIQRPLLLGFPVNSTRLYSLTSLCPMPDQGTKTDLSLLFLCSGSHDLPPLLSITGPGQMNQNPFDNLGSDNSPPPPSGITQGEAGDSDVSDDYETEPSPVAGDYETEPSPIDGGLDQQENPGTEVEGTIPVTSLAWKMNNSKCGLFVSMIMMLVTLLSK